MRECEVERKKTLRVTCEEGAPRKEATGAKASEVLSDRVPGARCTLSLVFDLGLYSLNGARLLIRVE